MTLDEYMTSEGISDSDLAEQMSVARTTISKLRRRKVWPSFQFAVSLVKKTGVDIMSLVPLETEAS